MIDYLNEIEAQTTYLQGANEMENLIYNFSQSLAVDSKLKQDFFQDDKDTTKKKVNRKKLKPYSNTKVKAWNFLTNILYRRYKDTDFKKNNFVVDVFSFLIQNLNATMLDWKFDSDIERDYIKMLWEHCIQRQLCKFIYLKHNFTQLWQPQITFQKANNTIKDFIGQEVVHIELLCQYLQQYAVIYQYLYANLFPKVYTPNTQFRIHNQTIFEYTYREWYAEKKQINEIVVAAVAVTEAAT